MKLDSFNTTNLFEAATDLFRQLGIKLNSNTSDSLPIRDVLKNHYRDNDTFKAIENVFFIGIIDDSVFKDTGMFDMNYTYNEALQQGDKNYEGLMLFAIKLKKQPTRAEISELTRSFNRISQKMPVALLLKYKTENEAAFSIAISERFKYKQNWRQGEKAGKVIILRDIHTKNTHAGHERILIDLVKPVGISNYEQLHAHWLQVLDVNVLNKKFFQDLANWYFWALENVSFPDDLEKKEDVRNATNLIRLITRVVFIWFIKEKSLVPNAIFNRAYLDKILKDFNKNKKSQNYYHAILQNLFFGTLNQKTNERKFAKEGDHLIRKDEYGVKNLYRYSELFTISEKEVLNMFKDVPFLNGGLFDCLDKPNEDSKIMYVDGFSRNPKKQANIPDYFFFGEETEIDLNDIYGTKNKKYKSKGLINILESYKFTVAENTPIEEEIALDPELLGKVFENLLASYNPETRTTARKQTGSFYTPREIVNYMVDESLVEYLKQNVKNDDAEIETQLRKLISYSETPNPFDEKESKALIEAINNCKILDPACGSGAYPMGILHKMVHLLQKLDPENKHWKALQRQKAMEETEAAFKIGDKEERGKRLAEINDVFENNASDYGRKLYLIENCIYGIDIQPIAVQISKLRFFISLIIDQNKQTSKENYGIRSLPNLETKFVAANTLIGLDKPAQTLLRNPDIEVKENQLKDLRHKYFTANTRKEKLQYQKQDKKLRQEIAKMLESDGWQTAVAKQIVAFDPYDQNTFAPWFDPEWMFGLNSGFDIVIGNPPYVQIKQIPEADKPYYLKRFKFATGRFNLFYFFIEMTEKLTRKNGISAYIVPDRLLLNTQCVDLRNWLLNQQTITEIDSFDESVFDSAVVDSIILFYKNVKNATKTVYAKSNVSVNAINSSNGVDIPIIYFANSPNNQFDLNYSVGKSNLVDKIRKDSVPLGDISDTRDGIIQSKIPDILFLNRKENKFCKPLLFGKDINRFELNYDNNWVNYQPEEMMKIELKRGGGGLRLRTKDIFERDKILTRQTADRIIGTLDSEHYYYSNTLHGTAITDKTYNIKYVLALLNSSILNYYYKSTTSEGGKVFAQMKIEILRQLPIKYVKNQKPFIIIVDFIILLKKASIDATFFERLIDAMVYELYLTEEIKKNGADVLKHLDNLPEIKEVQDEKNIKTIEKVHKDLSDPKHPISAALLKLLTIEEINIIEGRN